MKIRTLILLPLLLFVTGCSTMQSWYDGLLGNATNDAPAIIDLTTNIASVIDELDKVPVGNQALVIDLTKVSPDAYDGWGGACPGTDVDGDVAMEFAREYGMHITHLENQQATLERVQATALKLSEKVPSGGLFFIFFSGHGGQIPDLNGDEDDGQDETICLWDGQLSDDLMDALWHKMSPSIRVFFVTDSCNAGTNYKLLPLFRPDRPRGITCPMIHWGGCADGESSYGGDSGGTFTTGMVDGHSPSNTYLTGFEATKAQMPRDQVPVYGEYGPVTPEFRNAPVFR